MGNTRGFLAGLGRAEAGVGFFIFALAALVLLPATAYAGALEIGAGAAASFIAGALGVAVGVQLIRWRQRSLRQQGS